MVVAIDGPAGAGKSTVARETARKLGFGYLDSGAMYRALAVLLLDHDGDPAERAARMRLELGDRVRVDGQDVTERIRTREASEMASQVATLKPVRQALVQKQRELLEAGDWVAEGRDIGTVVAPDAGLKLFLTASPEARAKRRARDLRTDWRVVLKDQTLRDQQDSQREHSPLRPAPDAIELDTTDRTVEDVVGQVVKLVREASQRK